MRAGGAGRSSLACRSASASRRRPRACSWRRRSWSRAKRALRVRQLGELALVAPRRRADLDALTAPVGQQRLRAPPPRRSRCAEHDQRRDRQGQRVELVRELHQHRVLVLRAGGVEEERLAVLQHAVAHLEHLDVGGVALERDAEHVGGPHRVGVGELALHQVAHRREAVADRPPPARTPAPAAAARISASSSCSSPR